MQHARRINLFSGVSIIGAMLRIRPFPCLALLAAALLAVCPRAGAAEEGLASWYGGKFQGRRTASGEIFDTRQMTAAHKTLPFGTIVRVINLENGLPVEVRINDRGPFVEGRVIDLSQAAAAAIGLAGAGVARVRIEVVSSPAAARHSVQLGAFRDPLNAGRLQEKARAAGFGAVLEEGAGGVVRVVIPEVGAGELPVLTDKLTRAGFDGFLVRSARPSAHSSGSESSTQAR